MHGDILEVQRLLHVYCGYHISAIAIYIQTNAHIHTHIPMDRRHIQQSSQSIQHVANDITINVTTMMMMMMIRRHTVVLV